MTVSLTSVANHEARERLLQHEAERQERMREYGLVWAKAWARKAQVRRKATPFRRVA